VLGLSRPEPGLLSLRNHENPNLTFAGFPGTVLDIRYQLRENQRCQLQTHAGDELEKYTMWGGRLK
jgi:hypothetical protein